MRCPRARRGATIVEFALFFMVFLMVAVGLMELGRGVWTYTTLSHAARAGARYAIVHGSLNPIDDDDTTIENVVKANAVGLDPAEITVNTAYESYDSSNGTWSSGAANNVRGNVVEVAVSYPFRLVTGPLLLAQDTINMRSTTRMVIGN
jgi:Flp pilus assembly protein TadG